MKRRGENLAKHYQQAFDYWLELVPDRPAYVLLSNFDEIWVYDFNRQLRDPLQKIAVAHLAESGNTDEKALAFLTPEYVKDSKAKPPEFNRDRVKVTKAAADLVANVYNSLVGERGDRPSGNIPKPVAQRYVLACLVALFSEDAELLPSGLFGDLMLEAQRATAADASYDLVGSLFRQMNAREPVRAGRFKDVPYFNGGLFAAVEPVPLNFAEIEGLRKVSRDYKTMSVVAPTISRAWNRFVGNSCARSYRLCA